MAQYEATKLRRKGLIVPILKDKIEMSEFPRDLRYYLRRTTYIDATENTDHMTALIRYSCNFTQGSIPVGCVPPAFPSSDADPTGCRPPPTPASRPPGADPFPPDADHHRMQTP